MSDPQPLMYGRLAGWFHLLSAPDEYIDEAAEVLRILEAHVEPPLVTALELGSGGGCLASHLTGRLRLTLTDPSTPMLDASRALNDAAEHIEGDMRTLRLGREFDAVIVHDAIVYMRTEDDLRAAFETAWLHLRPGGAAIFIPDWVRDDYVPATEHGGTDQDGRGLRYLEWDRPIEPDGRTVLTDYLIITRDADGDVEVFHDVHRMGIFPRQTWLTLLEEVGFEPLRLVGEDGRDIFVGLRPHP